MKPGVPTIAPSRVSFSDSGIRLVDGSITDLVILQPSSIEAFNNAAYGAIVTSNPTAPLPPEYPSDQALFTVTFYYNEEPPN